MSHRPDARPVVAVVNDRHGLPTEVWVRRHAAGLTARQAEVLDLLAEELSNIEIADRLFLSPRTVENHVAAILDKLDTGTRSEAVARARSEGLLGPTPTSA